MTISIKKFSMIWDVYYILNLSFMGDNCPPSNAQKTYAYERF